MLILLGKIPKINRRRMFRQQKAREWRAGRSYMEWKTIESAPRDGANVLLFFPDYKRKVWLGHYNIHESFTHGKLDYRSEGWIFGSVLAGFGEKPEPTHWMPIPEGPSAADDAL